MGNSTSGKQVENYSHCPGTGEGDSTMIILRCMRSGHASDRATAPGISKRGQSTNIATENQFMHFELHVFYGDVLTLKNAEIRG